MKLITVPKLDDADAIYVLLHECGHVRLGHHEKYYSLHVMEYEAERFAIGIMRVEGLTVPFYMIREAKEYVADCIVADVKRGEEIRGYIRRWARKSS